MNIETDVTLLLTASVDPKGMPGIPGPDPAERENSYAECFEYYLQDHPRVQKVVFAENSGWPLDRFEEIAAQRNSHAKQIELLSFNCNNFPREKGKSFGELLLIEKALSKSKLAQSSTYIAKMTGRNRVLNLTRLLETVRSDFDLCCDTRDHNFYRLLGRADCGHHCDSRFFLFAPRFFQRYIKNAYAERPPGYLIENLLYDLVKQHEHSGRVIKRYRVEPDYRGSAGHFIRGEAKDYGSSKEILKRRIRSGCRVVAPWLHI